MADDDDVVVALRRAHDPALTATPTRTANKNARRSMGLSGLSNQIYRKVAKKGYGFNLMVCGERNLGKSTLLETLFGPEVAMGDGVDVGRVDSDVRATQSVSTSPRTVELSEKGVNLRLTIIDTPGFGDLLNNRECYAPLEKYIDDAFRSYIQDESRPDRKDIIDRRVHCLLYFLSPSSHGLKPIDIITMKKLQSKVNIVPVIAKADMLSKSELANLKTQILEDIQSSGIEIFMPSIESVAQDEELDADSAAVSLELAAAIPFAVVGSTATHTVEGKQVRGRIYPWGLVEVDNAQHCDFVLLKKMLVNTHLHDLKETTEDVLYERFRMHMLEKSGGMDDLQKNDSVNTSVAIESEEELRKKHEDMKKDLEEQSRLLAEQRRLFEEERKRFESLTAAKAAEKN